MDTDETPVALASETPGETPAQSETRVASAPVKPGTGARAEAEKMYRAGRYSQAEIAERLGLNVGTVKSWIARGNWCKVPRGNGNGETRDQGCKGTGEVSQLSVNTESSVSSRGAPNRATAPEIEDPGAAEIARIALERIRRAKVPEVRTIRELQIIQAIYDKATGRDKGASGNGRGVNIMILSNGPLPASLPVGTVTDAEVLPD